MSERAAVRHFITFSRLSLDKSCIMLCNQWEFRLFVNHQSSDGNFQKYIHWAEEFANRTLKGKYILGKHKLG